MMEKEAEFADVYKQYKEIVWSVASRYFMQKEDREEAFQETFIRVYKYLPGLQRGETDNFKAWIYKVSVSTSINLYNRNKRQRMIGDVLKFAQRFWQQDDAVEVDVTGTLQERLLAPLNAQQRAVFILREIEDLSYEEIADAMNLKIGTVKSTLNRAKQKLKETLEGREAYGY